MIKFSDLSWQLVLYILPSTPYTVPAHILQCPNRTLSCKTSRRNQSQHIESSYFRSMCTEKACFSKRNFKAQSFFEKNACKQLAKVKVRHSQTPQSYLWRSLPRCATSRQRRLHAKPIGRWHHKTIEPLSRSSANGPNLGFGRLFAVILCWKKNCAFTFHTIKRACSVHMPVKFPLSMHIRRCYRLVLRRSARLRQPIYKCCACGCGIYM